MVKIKGEELELSISEKGVRTPMRGFSAFTSGSLVGLKLLVCM